MSFSLWNIVALLPLFLLSVYTVVMLRTPLLKRLGRALFHAVALSALLAAALHIATTMQHWALNIGLALILAVLSALTSFRRAHTHSSRMFLPLMVGTVAWGLLLSIYCVFLIFPHTDALQAQCLLPVVGLIVGGSAESSARSLATYVQGARHHYQLFQLLLGNGATPHEAHRHFVKRSVEAALVPLISRMGQLALTVSPAVLWVAVYLGVAPIDAALLEVTLLLVILAQSLGSIAITLLLAHRYGMDPYQRWRQSGDKVS